MSNGSQPVLIVNDCEDDVTLMERAFRTTDCRNPVICKSYLNDLYHYFEGTGAYTDRNSHPLPCIVLLDLMLKESNGFEVLKWMRCHPSKEISQLTIIIFSASTRECDREKAMELGADAYEVKPADFSMLRETAHRICDCWINAKSTAA